MFMVFLDESGSPYKDYSSFRDGYEDKYRGVPAERCPEEYFVLAAVGIHERHTCVVDEWFAGIKRDFLRNPSGKPGQQYEVKGELLYSLRLGLTPWAWQGVRKQKRSYLKAQRGIWQALTEYQLRKLEQSVFDLLGRLTPMLWAVVVNQRDVFRTYGQHTWPPYYHALTYIQQRVLQYVQATFGSYERAVFIMDETSTLSTAAQFDRYLTQRQTINQTAAWPVEFGRYLFDIPLSGKSHLHEALQLADIVAHAIRRHVQDSDPLRWFSRIAPLLQVHWRTGSYQNCGLKLIP